LVPPPPSPLLPPQLRLVFPTIIHPNAFVVVVYRLSRALYPAIWEAYSILMFHVLVFDAFSQVSLMVLAIYTLKYLVFLLLDPLLLPAFSLLSQHASPSDRLRREFVPPEFPPIPPPHPSPGPLIRNFQGLYILPSAPPRLTFLFFYPPDDHPHPIQPRLLGTGPVPNPLAILTHLSLRTVERSFHRCEIEIPYLAIFYRPTFFAVQSFTRLSFYCDYTLRERFPFKLCLALVSLLCSAEPFVSTSMKFI